MSAKRKASPPAEDRVNRRPVNLVDVPRTPEQCVEYVDTMQKTQPHPGHYIWISLLYDKSGFDTLNKFGRLKHRELKSEWLQRSFFDYEQRERQLEKALRNFNQDKAPVLEQLGEMIEWFMEFFTHKRVEKWQMDGTEVRFWNNYFTTVKNLAIGFGQNPAYFEGFSTDCNPFLIDLRALKL